MADALLGVFWLVWVVGLSAFLAATGRRMSLRQLAPNPTQGIRVARTLQNPEVWYAVHEKAGPGFVATGATGPVVYVVVWWLAGSGPAVGVWGLVVLAGVVVSSIWSLWTTP